LISNKQKIQVKITQATVRGQINDELARNIENITRYSSKLYFMSTLLKLSQTSPKNATIICDYILAEETQTNIKESTKEEKIKVLIWLSNHFQNKKSFRQMTKQDVLEYLNGLRKPLTEDPTHKWIGSYNN
jgi:hypothetical protein